MKTSTYSSSLLKLILMGAVLVGLFAAVAGSSLFFATGAGAQESAATAVATTAPSAEATVAPSADDQAPETDHHQPWGGQRPERGHRGGPLAEYISRDEIKTAIATTLGMTTDELKAAKQAGTTMEELAQQKGVTTEQLQAAVRPIVEKGVAQAVTDGVITQTQADEILAAEWPYGKGFWGGNAGAHSNSGGKGHRGGPLAEYISQDEIKTAIATTLGMTTDELKAARQAGTTLEELAQQKGITTEQLQAAVRPIIETGVAQAVADGVITQAQADEILARDPLGMPRGGRHGGKGWKNQQRPNNAPVTTSDANA